MKTEFETWADEITPHVHALESAIHSACASVRELRTRAVRIDRQKADLKKVDPKEASRVQANSLSEFVVGNSVEYLSGAAQSADATLPPANRLIAEISTSLRELEAASNRIKEIGSDTAPSQPGSRSVPVSRGILQVGAKHFAVLASVFQLQDNFEQRLDHVRTGISKGLCKDLSVQQTVGHLISTLYLDLADSVIEFADSGALAVAGLAELSDRQGSDSSVEALYVDPELSVEVKKVLDRLETIVATCQALILEIESADITQTLTEKLEKSSKQEEGFSGVRDAILSLHEQAVLQIKSLRIFAQSYAGIENTDLNFGFEEDVAAVLVDIEKLAYLAKKLADLAYMDIDQKGLELCLEAESCLKEISESYTMEQERKAHQTFLHRLQ